MKVCIVILVIALGVCIVGGCARPAPVPAPEFPPPPSEPEPPVPIEIERDSFVLEAYNSEEWRQWFEEHEALGENWLSYVGVPFNMGGRYWNRIYFKENETVRVTLKSDKPMGLPEVEDLSTEHGGELFHISVGEDESLSGHLLAKHGVSFCELRRATDGNWELMFTFRTKESADYYFYIGNTNRYHEEWCQYVIELIT